MNDIPIKYSESIRSKIRLGVKVFSVLFLSVGLTEVILDYSGMKSILAAFLL